MEKKRDIQDIGVVFGDWKLVPLDSNNWELCHRHVTKDTASARANGTVGTVKWHRLGRYYQFNTVHLALEYAADWDIRNGNEESMELGEYIDELEANLGRFEADFAECLASIIGK